MAGYIPSTPSVCIMCTDCFSEKGLDTLLSTKASNPSVRSYLFLVPCVAVPFVFLLSLDGLFEVPEEELPDEVVVLELEGPDVVPPFRVLLDWLAAVLASSAFLDT